MERYRAKLRSLRRKRGESIQAVYQDIRRLLALGFRSVMVSYVKFMDAMHILKRC